MRDVIEFLAMIGCAVALIVVTVVGSAIMLGAAFGNIQWLPAILFGVIGGVLAYTAWVYSPFHVTFIGG